MTRKLPGDDAYNLPVTMDLNGQVAIRGKAGDQDMPTELILTGSAVSGEPVRINTNRWFLGRAIALGFREVHVTSPKTPVLCCDDCRHYAWAILERKSAIAPSPDAIQIVSSQEANATAPPNPRPRRRKHSMSASKEPKGTPKSTTNGRAKGRSGASSAAGTNAVRQDAEALIEQAEGVKASLRDALAKTTELVRSLKRHRKLSKTVHAALVSLRELGPAGDR